MNKIALCPAILAMTLLPLASHAKMPELYVSGSAGFSFLEKNNLHEQEQVQLISNMPEVKYNTGYRAEFAIGHHYYNGVRSEIELGLQSNYAKVNATNPSYPGSYHSGDTRSFTVMGNVLYDFLRDAAFTPYIGMGAGVADVHFRNIQPVGGSSIDDSTYEPAIQFIAGASYAINSKVSVFTNYKFLTAYNGSFHTEDGNTKVDARYNSHAIMLGLRYNIGGPEPVVLREAAPEKVITSIPPATLPEKNYQVFFDFDKSTVTPEAVKILQEAAAGAHSGNVIRITATGHTDTMGTNKYNQRLSDKRAEAVKKELVKLGVTDKEIVTVGKGKKDLLVPTGDGVREPQNRRVEIVYTLKDK